MNGEGETLKVEQISPHIWRLHAWILIDLNVWLIKEREGLVLIDTGFFMGGQILKAIENLQAGPLIKILLTHGHGDHVGSIRKIVKKTNVPVFAHRVEIPYMTGRIPYPGNKKTKVFVPNDMAQPLKEDEQGNLLNIGSLQPYFTPGHSPGHVVYYHEEDHVLLSGDLFTSKKGRLHRPMPWFTANMMEAIESGVIVQQIKPKRVEVTHGDAVYDAADQVDDYIIKYKREFAHYPIKKSFVE